MHLFILLLDLAVGSMCAFMCFLLGKRIWTGDGTRSILIAFLINLLAVGISLYSFTVGVIHG